jgi:pimeloyl-ACP methyl ester carboxylesterase
MARTPVVFIPGLTGSFNLPILLDWRPPGLGGWSFPPFIDYGKGFVAAFERAGYTRDRDLFVAFYDWRRSVKDTAEQYLRPWLRRARERSGAGKVILIGHSMGGLVARSYIQSANYANDVEHLITIGTPHRGAAESYYAWGSGETRSDPTVQAVFRVYLWYLRHAHPFQTELDPLRTMRTQVPSVRDLLPIDGYLFNQGGPELPRPPDTLQERNLVGELLNQPAAVESLVRRAPVTTLVGSGFPTISGITVAGPPIPPGTPPRFPDGVPVADRVSNAGDGTVLTDNARVNHPQVSVPPPLPVSHGALPDHPAVLSAIFAALGEPAPVLGAPPVQEPQLVIMTASPVKMSVRTPAGAPMPAEGVLGAPPEAAPRRRSRRIRARDHGHRGKHLNIVVVPNPPPGAYEVHLDGTATGDFALGALIIGAESPAILGGGDVPVEPQPTATPIVTVHGRVAAASELFYQVVCHSTSTPPEVHFDGVKTARNAVARLRSALSEGGGVLGGGLELLGGLAGAALSGDDAALDQMAAALDSASGVGLNQMLCTLAERDVGSRDEALAEALITQLQALQR